jgi:DNA repair exonuclease SbcCD ATPase subunit
MKNVGWFEYSTESDRTEKMGVAVQKYLSSINNSQESPAINEGGVDVAEDTVTKAEEVKPLDEPIAPSDQGQAETEVEASVESESTDLTDGADETKDEAEKAADVSEVDDAEDDLAKMFDNLDAKISDSLLKNKEAVDSALSEVNDKMEKFTAEMSEKLSELDTKNAELSEKFASIKDELGKMEKSIDQLNGASAIKKSADLGGSDEAVVETEKAATSTWGGHFLGANSLR